MADEAPETKPVGRPTVYTPELVEMALDYLENYRETYTHEFPSVVGLCAVLKRSRAMIYRWADKDGDIYHEEFADILASINETQQLVLLNNGINGTFNPAITKLVLGKHGFHDKQDTHVKEFNVNIGTKDADTL